MGLEMGEWSSYYTFPRDHIFMELRPKEIPKYENIATCFDVPTWIGFFVSFVIVIIVLHLSHSFSQGSEEVVRIALELPLIHLFK